MSESSDSKETSFSRDVFRHFKDIIKHNNQQQKKSASGTDDEEYGFKELEQKLKERREKEKEDLKKCQDATKEESAKRLKQLEREQNQKLPKPKQSFSSPRTRNSIAACGPTRRSYESVMTSQARPNFVRTPKLNRRQREHIVQQLEKFKKPKDSSQEQLEISRRKESSVSQPSKVAASVVPQQGSTFQVAMQYRDVKYCNDPRNRRFAVDQRSGTKVQSSYQGNILPFVLQTKVTSQRNPIGVYYDDTMMSQQPPQHQRSNKNANNSVNHHKPPAYNPAASSRENLRRNAFMTSQEMYEENRERRKVQREMRKMNKNATSGRQPPLNGAREQNPAVQRCLSEENVFSSSQQDRNSQVLNKRHLRRQKSADDSASSSSLRRRHTLGTGDDVTDDDGRRPPPSGGNGRNPPDYNEHRRKTSTSSAKNHRATRHKKESYL